MREREYLRRRYRSIFAAVGSVLLLVGGLMAAPLTVAIAFPVSVGTVWAFAGPAVGVAMLGLALRRLAPRDAELLTMHEGGVIVLLGWLSAGLFGALPLLFEHGLTFTQAVFESVSGWTTTGLSVIDVTTASPATLLWRSTMQLAGGAGLVIITLAMAVRTGGASLAVAEGRGDNLEPNVRVSARLVLRIYGAFVAVGVVALRLAGMSWFDAINHSFCALSTGGFSTRTDSIGHWDSPAIEAVVLVLMVLGSLSFVTSWSLLRGRFRIVARNGEVRLMAVLVALFAAVLLLGTCLPTYASATKAVRVAVFETLTALTTTGYSTVGYSQWNPLGVLSLVLLMLVGAGSCSTGGAIKQFRVYLLVRGLWTDLLRPLRPGTRVVDTTVWLGEQPIALTDALLRSVATWSFLYLATWLAGAGVLAARGCGLGEALFEFGSALGTVGLSIGVTGPATDGVVLWTECVGMLLGRLEFLVVFAGCARLLLDARVLLRRGGRT